MSSNSKMKEVARFVADAFDVDIQLFVGKALKNLSKTSAGLRIVSWAKSNPIAFETLLRLISASVQRMPRNGNIILETVANQLSRLPVEIRRAILDPEDGLSDVNSSHVGDLPFNIDSQQHKTLDTKQYLLDHEFRTRYEDALAGLSEEDLGQVFELEPDKLQEWVNSPSRIRPLFLRKYSEEKEKLYQKSVKDRAEAFIKALDILIAHGKPLNEKIGFVDDFYNDFKKELQESLHFTQKEKDEVVRRIDDLLRRYVDKLIDAAIAEDPLTHDQQIEELVESTKDVTASFYERLSDNEKINFLANMTNLPKMSDEEIKNVHTAISAFASQVKTMLDGDQNLKRKWFRMSEEKRNEFVQTALLNTLRKFNLSGSEEK